MHVTTDHGHTIRDAVLAGDTSADMVALPVPMIDALADRGFVAREGIAALGSVGIGAVTRAGATLTAPDDMARLREALLAADAVFLTLAPTGEHLLNVIRKLGLAQAVERKLRRFDKASHLNAALAASLATHPLGFAPVTEILSWQPESWQPEAGVAANSSPAAGGITFLGHVPDEIQDMVHYAAALRAGTTRMDIGRKVLAALTGSEARLAFRQTGMR